MAHPYREKQAPPPLERAPAARLDAASAAFGFCCAVVGLALAGPRWAVAITVGGVVLLLMSPRR